MDEPLAWIDPVRQGLLLRELIRMQEGYGITLVVATNDQRVAMSLAHRIAVLDDGEVVQVGAPDELYARPVNLFVAGFIGSPPMNLLDGIITKVEGRTEIHADPFVLPTWSPNLSRRVGEPVVLGVRPHQVVVDPGRGRASERLRVVRRGFLGAEVELHLRTRNGRHVAATVGAPGPEDDAQVQVRVDPAHVHLFEPVTDIALAHGV
jgi:multiple sugar transport system ATP-binding protein